MRAFPVSPRRSAIPRSVDVLAGPYFADRAAQKSGVRVERLRSPEAF
jgi:hypothetical protein